MSDCPNIRDLFEGVDNPQIVVHVDACTACQAVLTMMADHDVPTSEEPECALAELQIAVREAGGLSADEAAHLDAHLVECGPCRQAAGEPAG